MKKIIIILLIVNCQLATVHGQWVQQTLPVSGQVNDIVFFDQSTGVIALNTMPGMIYRTTDGGFNWTFVNNMRIFRFNKIDSQAVYGNGDNGTSQLIYRTFNKGFSWDSVGITGMVYTSLSFINHDTGWVCGHNGSMGAIWLTTNGGVSLQQQLSSGTSGMDRIFFLKEKVNGYYMGWCSQASILRKTTDSGLNWSNLPSFGASGYNQVYFINKDTGWSAASISGEVRMYNTLNGGLNWFNQPLPNDPSFVSRSISRFIFINKDVGYGVGGNRFINSQFRGIIWKTTNGGANWGYQQPDTQIQIGLYTVIDFADTMVGWAYAGQPGIHTTVGGGPIIFTAVNQISSNVPEEYKLYQNYPNPFNPNTIIKFTVKREMSNMKLVVFDVLGKEIAVLINQQQRAGTYTVDWNASTYPSGIYFYQLTINNKQLAELYKETKKMILIK